MIISTRLNGCISNSEQWTFEIQNFDLFSYYTYIFPKWPDAVLGFCLSIKMSGVTVLILILDALLLFVLALSLWFIFSKRNITIDRTMQYFLSSYMENLVFRAPEECYSCLIVLCG